ncbi:helix-turn-helix domain-containing protein [Chryseobacterium lathyri]|uniref:Insertion element IS150 protein InsJ-like helix-turn-helix domain-containing protein n=1 Tax=Chryseobacterium lathyri TaxID=395933 RepID=A0A511YFQ8_9FLAO|nr:helix-turn-helix domain-containing protein [Chryseobacterium lathyri]GEN74032.1 hypothetical protein CLA01_41040 [Chryseobacterium lathyri]
MDILEKKIPDKKQVCQPVLEKEKLSSLDIIELNTKIFGYTNKKAMSLNQKFRSYGKSDILLILDYQKAHHLNNSQLACHFKLSRGTVARWKKIYIVNLYK